LVLGAWCLVLGAWCLVLGAWCLVLGAWCLVLGAWCLVLGAWCLVFHGPQLVDVIPHCRDHALRLCSLYCLLSILFYLGGVDFLFSFATIQNYVMSVRHQPPSCRLRQILTSDATAQITMSYRYLSISSTVL
jgi:hypothetical protein